MNLNYRYYEHFIEFWLPIYRNQILEAKLNDDEEALKIIFKNIDCNWHLQEYKELIFKNLGIKYLYTERDSIIISAFFKRKKRKEDLDFGRY